LRTDILFGGSFNPVHVGHLIVAQDVYEMVKPEKLIFVPAYIQPLKGKLLFPPAMRIEMLKSCIEGDDRFSVWDVEIRKRDKSYTVETLEYYREKRGRKPLFLMGTDSLLTLHEWREPERILELSTILVASRGNRSDEEIAEYVERRFSAKVTFGIRGDILSSKVVVLRTRRVDISSTEIRERLEKGKSIRYLVTEKVEEMIRRRYAREEDVQEDEP